MRQVLLLFTIHVSLFMVLPAQERFGARPEALYFGNMPVKVDSALTMRFPNTVVYRDSLGNLFFQLKVMPQGPPPWGDVIAFEQGSPYENKGAIIFSELTQQELEYIIAEIRLFEKRKKVKQ